jgi:AraC-like DNA-binding protein
MSTGVKSWGGRLVLAPGIVLYIGSGGRADHHAHHAVQFVWAGEGTAEVTVSGRTTRTSAVLIPARVEHSFDATGARLALLLVDAHGARGSELDARAHAVLGEDLASRVAELPFPSLDLTLEEAEAWCRDVLGALGVASTDTRAPSRPTRLAIAYIEEALDGVPRIGAAAERASTSASRLSHRFSEEVGIPFRRFVLWTRVKRAVEVVQRGGDLTEAALAAGFSDAAHLSRTFRAMFGLSPSLVLPFVELTGKPWSEASPLAR